MITVYRCNAHTCAYNDLDSEDRCKCTMAEITIAASGSCNSYQTRCDNEEEEE